MPRLRVKLDQQIHVAIGAEVLTNCGAKQGQFNDLTATAEAVYLRTGNVKLDTHFRKFRS